jgi:hypothetical protein
VGGLILMDPDNIFMQLFEVVVDERFLKIDSAVIVGNK